MWLFWGLFGALIGISAANRRGFSVAGGIIGGLLLGPLAVLMYFASGDRRQCPRCAEWIKKQAVVCPYCKNKVDDNDSRPEDMTLGEMKKRGLIK